MLATVMKSVLLGLTLGAALAYAAGPDPRPGAGAGDYTRGRTDGDAASPQVPAPPATMALRPLPLAQPPYVPAKPPPRPAGPLGDKPTR
jgi:hypothetical protein